MARLVKQGMQGRVRAGIDEGTDYPSLRLAPEAAGDRTARRQDHQSQSEAREELTCGGEIDVSEAKDFAAQGLNSPALARRLASGCDGRARSASQGTSGNPGRPGAR